MRILLSREEVGFLCRKIIHIIENLLQKKKKISHPQTNLIMLRCRVSVFEDLQDEEVYVGEREVGGYETKVYLVLLYWEI